MEISSDILKLLLKLFPWPSLSQTEKTVFLLSCAVPLAFMAFFSVKYSKLNPALSTVNATDNEKSARIVEGILGGIVEDARFIRNLNPRSEYIAALWRRSEKTFERTFYIFKKNRKNHYLNILEREYKYGISKIADVVDLDEDGNFEVAVMAASHGTGGSSYTVTYFDIVRNAENVAAVRTDRNQRDTYSHSSDLSKIKDVNYRNAVADHLPNIVEEVQTSPEETSDVSNWYKENGDFERSIEKSTQFKMERKPGRADPSNSAASFKHKNLEFLAEFKGSLWCNDLSSNTHFLVYVPSWKYGWVSELEFVDDSTIRFTTHDDLVYSAWIDSKGGTIKLHLIKGRPPEEETETDASHESQD